MAKYQVTLKDGAGETVVLTANDPAVLQNKIRKFRDQLQKELQLALARQQTAAAQTELTEYRSLLIRSLATNHKIDWKSRVNRAEFTENEPILDDYYHGSIAQVLSFIPAVDSRLKQQRAQAEKQFKEAMSEYKKRKQRFLSDQKRDNEKVETQQAAYENNERAAVLDYFRSVLTASRYPDSLKLSYQLEYESNGKLLLVEVELPNKEKVPRAADYAYSPGRGEMIARDMKEREFEAFYNGTLYQIALRILHEVFESDYGNTIDLAVLNGMVEGFDPKTGAHFRNCVLSLQATKEQFSTLNLEQIDPQECFRYLKGVTAGSLVNLAPVKPIKKLDTNDDRVIKADGVLENVDQNQNLATMDWQDFETLTRDLLQKEFGTDGCKVEVTRASHDLGVDAIAFDEDPIRGGKFVIQAKRYNNLVPVSAVRDLYGTVMNEGAVKGILVTTSYYGPEAMEFVKNKPLTLINGEQLMYMFNKHGYQVKIELQKKRSAASYNSY